MILSKYISNQYRKPSGIIGRFIMSRFFEIGNAELNNLVFETLSLTEQDHVLEIGFGPGTLIKRAAEFLSDGIIEGIDLSESMVATALKKNRKHINSGKAKIQLGDIEKVPFENNRFDKIFTVNTIYFWENPSTAISKISHILKPGGKLIIGFHDRREMEKISLDMEVFRFYSKDNISELLSVHGSLNEIDIISKRGKHNTCYCVSGTKINT